MAPAQLGGQPAVAVEAVSKRYGGVVAVERADFEVGRGELFSLLGPSGCGKTTLLRLIAGFESATTGAIRLDGVDVSRLPPYRRNVNTVFQQYALFPHLDVFDNVAFGPRARGLEATEVERRVRRMLEVVRLEDLARRRPSQLSGGQKQRVALARALVNLPSALLLDEPLSALDAKLRQAMQLELKRIQREVRIAFVLVTHDQEEALTLSDRIAVLSAGRVEQVGTPEQIYDSPATAFVAGFVGTANLLPVRVEGQDGESATVRLAAGRTVVVPAAGRRFVVGDQALLMVRPERIRLAREEPLDGEPATPVTVVEQVFQGPVLRCILRDARGDDLAAHVAPAGRDTYPMPGEPAWASWERQAGRLLPR